MPARLVQREQAQCSTQFAQGCRRDRLRPLCAAPDGGKDMVGLTRERRPACADRGDDVLQHVLKALLDRAVAKPAADVAGLEIGDRVTIRIECVEIGEHHIAFNAARVGGPDMLRIGEHAPDSIADLVGRGGERNGVALRLAHLGLAVDARQASDGRDQRAGLLQHTLARLSVNPADDLVGLLDQRHLIVSDRDDGRLEGGDVGRLGDGIAQKAGWNVTAEAARLDFVLDRRVAFEPRDRDEVHIEQRQIGQGRQMRLQTDRGEIGIDADGEIVGRDLHNVPAHLGWIMCVVRERLGIRQQQELLMCGLKRDPVPQRADVMAEVQRAGGSVAGQDDWAFRG